ncbi:hypothetical protein [Pseudomonas sp. LB3P14]
MSGEKRVYAYPFVGASGAAIRLAREGGLTADQYFADVTIPLWERPGFGRRSDEGFLTFNINVG